MEISRQWSRSVRRTARHRHAVIVGQGEQFFQLVSVGRACSRSDGPSRIDLPCRARPGPCRRRRRCRTLRTGTGPQRAVEAVEPRFGRRILDPQSSHARCVLKPIRLHGRPSSTHVTPASSRATGVADRRALHRCAVRQFGEPFEGSTSSTKTAEWPWPLAKAVSNQSRSPLGGQRPAAESIHDDIIAGRWPSRPSAAGSATPRLPVKASLGRLAANPYSRTGYQQCPHQPFLALRR